MTGEMAQKNNMNPNTLNLKNIQAMKKANSIQKYADRQIFTVGIVMVVLLFVTLFITL